jgi:dTMP kinase
MPAEVMEVERPRAQQARLAAEQEAKRRELHRRQLAEEQSREAARRRAAERAERKAKKPESLEDREARLEKQRQARLGHVDEGLVPAEKAPAADPRVEALARRLPAITRNSLRDAVILNEILSPPLSIRD